MTGSQKGQLARGDVRRIAWGAAASLGGMLIVWLPNYIGDLDLTTTQGLIAAAVATVVLNTLRHWLTDTLGAPPNTSKAKR